MFWKKKQLGWKSYQEDYPTDKGCFEGDAYPYMRKHNPFMSFPAIRNSKERCQCIVNLNQLQIDIKNKNVPEFVFVTPNMIHNMHDGNTPFETGSKWLETFLEPLLVHPLFSKTLFLVTFDENVSFLKRFDLKKNRIYSVLLGSGIKPGTVDDTFYNHYSILATLNEVESVI